MSAEEHLKLESGRQLTRGQLSSGQLSSDQLSSGQLSGGGSLGSLTMSPGKPSPEGRRPRGSTLSSLSDGNTGTMDSLYPNILGAISVKATGKLVWE